MGRLKRTRGASAGIARTVLITGAALITGGLLSGCAATAAEEPPPATELSSFESVDELSAAVNGLYGCDPDTEQEPVTISFDGYLPEYAMCTEALQLVRFHNAEDREKVSGMLTAGGENVPPGFGEGSNWHVFVLQNGAEAPSEKDMKDLAYQLGGRYVSVTGPR